MSHVNIMSMNTPILRHCRNSSVPESERDADKSWRSPSPGWIAAGGLVLYALALTIRSGDIGFQGDDWWIFSWPYWHAFPECLFEYARASLRPVEGIYWVGLFEIFGFNRIAFHLFSLLLAAGSCLLLAKCLEKAFPEKKSFVITALAVSFFLPTVSCLTYVMATDNSRLSLLLFWACVLAFQRWAEKSRTWTGLGLPILLYLAAFLTYEAPSFLILTIPLFVLPVRERNAGGQSFRAFVCRLFGGIALSLGIAVGARFLVFSGGAVQHSSFVPPLDLLRSYVALLPHYIAAPFTDGSITPWGCATGLIMAAWFCGLIYLYGNAASERRQASVSNFMESPVYLILLGVTVFVLGTLPYQLAGYGANTPTIMESVMAKWGAIPGGNTAWFNYNWSGRIYSAGSFGVAIVVAAVVTGRKHRVLNAIGVGALAVYIGCAAAFHSDLSIDWKEAFRIRSDLIRSLVRVAPSVKTDSNLVLVGFPTSHKRANVFHGWAGLKCLVRMLYDDPSLGAWYVLPHAWKSPNYRFQQAVACPRGFISRGVDMDKPVPAESLILVGRIGKKAVLLDKICRKDRAVRSGICWSGVAELRTNSDRVLAASYALINHQVRFMGDRTRDSFSSWRIASHKLGFRLIDHGTVALRNNLLLPSGPLLKR
jgi:hypothetical protein